MPYDRALPVAREVAEGLAGDGADEAAVLVGPRNYSFRLERRGGLLASTSSRLFEAHRAGLYDPASSCAAVPGWRGPIVLHDPAGIGASLTGDAGPWTWKPLAERCDGWAVEEIASFAEEVHKLVAALRHGNRSAAAVQRPLLATHLAVHHHLLYGSENALWVLVGSAVGQESPHAQSSTNVRSG